MQKGQKVSFCRSSLGSVAVNRKICCMNIYGAEIALVQGGGEKAFCNCSIERIIFDFSSDADENTVAASPQPGNVSRTYSRQPLNVSISSSPVKKHTKRVSPAFSVEMHDPIIAFFCLCRIGSSINGPRCKLLISARLKTSI